MNRKGFTLIELLAVIIVIALIATIVTPSVIEYVNSAKKTYKSYACQINGSTITTTLGALANTGMLSVNNVDPNDKNKKIVINPKDNTDISSCNITITKTVDTNYKVTYNITSTNCSYINGSIN